MKNHISLSSVLAGLGTVLLAFIIAASFAAGVSLENRWDKTVHVSPTPSVETVTQPAAKIDIVSFEQALIGIYKNTVPSVVNIRIRQRVEQSSADLFKFYLQPSPTTPFPKTPQAPMGPCQCGEGSGIVWDKEGHIVTNYHVVADATDIVVSFANGCDVDAVVVGTDPDTDLAVLKVNVPAGDLHPLLLADSDTVQPGQLAIAIGNPFGQEFTMTSGIVSAVGRTIDCENSSHSISGIIQTDAPINPGNSGGPLLNHKGEVIGINTQMVSRNGANTGIGFAIPVNIARQIVSSLIGGDSFDCAWLGITGITLTPEMVNHIKFPVDAQGVLVTKVIHDSPADEAGLQGCNNVPKEKAQEYQLGADVIVAVNNQCINKLDELNAYLIKEARPGDEVTLDIIRANGQQECITVTVGVRPRLNTSNREL